MFEDLAFVGGQIKKTKSKPPINPVNNNKFVINDSRLKGLESIYLKTQGTSNPSTMNQTRNNFNGRRTQLDYATGEGFYPPRRTT